MTDSRFTYPDFTSNGKYKVIGTRPIRHDGLDKVTGQAIYGADVRLPNLLYGKLKRSPHAHAKILSIDTSKALQLDGVRAVATADDLVEAVDKLSDIGETIVNIREVARNSLASGKVLYKGHAVAAVAATSPHIADEALELIEVKYEPLPAVTDVREAMKDDAPLLDEDRTTKAMGEDTGKKSNIASHNQHKLGDIDQGFAQADVIIEREFHTATVHQGYIEPHNTTVHWRRDGTITVWVSTQGPFQIRAQLADVLQVPLSKIKVIPCEIGGGFGGKFEIYMEPAAAIMSQKTGHPVQMVMSRTEEFEASGPGPGSFHEGEDGRYQRRRHRRRLCRSGLRGGSLPRIGRGRRRHVHLFTLRHPQHLNRCLRRGPQQAQIDGLSRPRRPQRRLRLGDRHRRDSRKTRHGSSRATAQERLSRGHASLRRHRLQAHRLRGDTRRRHQLRAQQERGAAGTLPRPWRGFGILGSMAGGSPLPQSASRPTAP